MAPQARFSKDELIKILEWWFELRDLDKVRWRYAKEKGIEEIPRKLPKKKVFKCVIDRFWMERNATPVISPSSGSGRCSGRD